VGFVVDKVAHGHFSLSKLRVSSVTSIPLLLHKPAQVLIF
jgi:hypothetical protein